MNILIAGGTGFIGSALCSRLLEEQHNIVVISRHPELVKSPIRAISDIQQLSNADCFDAVINLTGEPIADKRWSAKQKKLILDSRINSTEQLISYFRKSEHKPKLLINGSAIGFYGVAKTDDLIDEDKLGDDSFSSQLCQQWESTALEAEALGIRTCLLRTGVVLGKNGGALSKMVLPFKLGLGGRIGHGKQYT